MSYVCIYDTGVRRWVGECMLRCVILWCIAVCDKVYAMTCYLVRGSIASSR